MITKTIGAAMVAVLVLSTPANAQTQATFNLAGWAKRTVVSAWNAVRTNNGGASSTAASRAYDAKQRGLLGVLTKPGATRAEKDAARRASMALREKRQADLKRQQFLDDYYGRPNGKSVADQAWQDKAK